MLDERGFVNISNSNILEISHSKSSRFTAIRFEPQTR